MTCRYATAPEQTPLVLMDRVTGITGEPITINSIDSVSYYVTAYATRENAEADDDGEDVGTEGELAPSACVYDELQTDPPWDSAADALGYNLRFTLPGARRPSPGWHRVEVWLHPVGDDAEPFPLVWIVRTKPLASA